MNSISARPSVSDMEEWHSKLLALQEIAPNEARTPQHGGLFACERDVAKNSCESESDEESELEVPQRIVFDTVSEQIRQRAIRMMFGYAKKTVTIGAYVAYTARTQKTPDHQQQDFWLGQVTDTNTSERTLSILMFHKSKLPNGDIRPGTQGATYMEEVSRSV